MSSLLSSYCVSIRSWPGSRSWARRRSSSQVLIAVAVGLFFLEQLYGHFLIDGAIIIGIYGLLVKMRFKGVDAGVLAVLVSLSTDQLYQVPLFAYYWPQSWSALAVGLASIGWGLISLPVLFYFLQKFTGVIRPRPDGEGPSCLRCDGDDRRYCPVESWALGLRLVGALSSRGAPGPSSLSRSSYRPKKRPSNVCPGHSVSLKSKPDRSRAVELCR